MKTHPVLSNSKPEFSKIPDNFNPFLKSLGAPHVDSFNDLLQHGLKTIVERMNPCSFRTPAGEHIELFIQHINIAKPSVSMKVLEVRNRIIYPREARQARRSYCGMCHVRLGWRVDGLERNSIEVEMGEIPIMLMSDVCNLSTMNPKQLVEQGEHDNEWGGIFIIKGNEKIIRMLLMARRNFPVAIKRSSWKDRGVNFSDIGIYIRCVRDDATTYNNVLHYLNNGTCKLMFSHMKMLTYVPICLILKCLVNWSDEMIYCRLKRGQEQDRYYLACLQEMLREIHDQGLHTMNDCKNYLGQIFRSRFPEISDDRPHSDITDIILREKILIHLDKYEEKFDLLVLMVQKLYQCVQDKVKVENIDSVMMQEVLTPGHLYQTILSDRLEVWLLNIRRSILKQLNTADALISSAILNNCLRHSGSFARALESFLATGNIASRSGLGLMQNSGLAVMAENINRTRYMSHFRAVHRGSFFTTMRTTEARQLLPDAWGFICPVHTPDGSPCGLLNHLTVTCRISRIPKREQVDLIPELLIKYGMLPLNSKLIDFDSKMYPVLLEGKHLGYIRNIDSEKIVSQLRMKKIHGELPEMMEIALIPTQQKGQFPGLYLFVGPSRLMRPVRNLTLNCIEYIGSLEQVYMEIAIEPTEIYPQITTHLEIRKRDFLSNLANLIPLPDYNQSPRNMYQCQMAKQTMGTPCLNWPEQAGNKLYRLMTPNTPLFRPVHYDNIGMDDFPMGLNAIVAVISYTGYDMEDAMIINKAAYERGFGDGSIYKSKFIELPNSGDYFARNPQQGDLIRYLGNDGLPHIGAALNEFAPLYCYFSCEESVYKVIKLDEKEECYVDSVRLCGNLRSNVPRMVCITLRIPRSPTIGDKFASRAGQKGICSQKYPAEDLPFTESGLIPDIVFNPHGFPSRMTIAMMIETMAGKSGALHGLVHDATPFRFTEKSTAIDYFGKMLEHAGYNYYGTESLYSGVDGREMTADIFFGIVHYQRLRHMVYDKWQVRSTGPVDMITHQPIKGRKRGGGVRFGEMERDALISHGAAFLLQDRLFHNSDKTYSLACHDCGSILAPLKRITKRSQDTNELCFEPEMCRLCGHSSNVGYIEIPYSLKYLFTELSSVNINARFKLNEV